MKRLFALPLLLLFAASMLTSCTPEEVTQQNFDDAQLRAGTWTVEQVDVNTFDGQGFLVSTDIVPFGEGEEGGICTFTYTDDSKFVLYDNGNEYTYGYELEGRVIYASNGDEWGIRKLTGDELEVVLRGDEVYNPCVFSASGAVYKLSRTAR